MIRLIAWAMAIALLAAPAARARQDPASSADHPPGNVNELTLAGLEPGHSELREAIRRFGPGWSHPSPEETDMYRWCDAHSGLQLDLEAQQGASVVRVVTVRRLEAPAASCRATLGADIGRTGRGVRLGDDVGRLKLVYGKPFFDGPSSYDGKDVRLVVFNFSWAGASLPQILESTFDAGGRLVKMTLSADYY